MGGRAFTPLVGSKRGGPSGDNAPLLTPVSSHSVTAASGIAKPVTEPHAEPIASHRGLEWRQVRCAGRQSAGPGPPRVSVTARWRRRPHRPLRLAAAATEPVPLRSRRLGRPAIPSEVFPAEGNPEFGEAGYLSEIYNTFWYQDDTVGRYDATEVSLESFGAPRGAHARRRQPPLRAPSPWRGGRVRLRVKRRAARAQQGPGLASD